MRISGFEYKNGNGGRKWAIEYDPETQLVAWHVYVLVAPNHPDLTINRNHRPEVSEYNIQRCEDWREPTPQELVMIDRTLDEAKDEAKLATTQTIQPNTPPSLSGPNYYSWPRTVVGDYVLVDRSVLDLPGNYLFAAPKTCMEGKELSDWLVASDYFDE
jgi:hypothetical protein